MTPEESAIALIMGIEDIAHIETDEAGAANVRLMLDRGSDFSFSDLLGDLKQIKDLKRLDLMLDGVPIPYEIGELGQLEYLLIWTQLFAEVPTCIGDLSNLRTLWFEGRGVTAIPVEICRLNNLETLGFTDSAVAELPPEIELLGNLRHLYLMAEGITELPAEIGRLENLESLEIVSGSLSSVPKEIGHLKKLRSLEIFDSNVGMPTWLFGLSLLEVLRIMSWPQIESIPSDISRLQNLVKLDLQYNKLSDLPAEIGELRNLRELNLSGNRFVELPFEITQLENLSALDLKENPLSPALAAASKSGTRGIMDYVRSRSADS